LKTRALACGLAGLWLCGAAPAEPPGDAPLTAVERQRLLRHSPVPDPPPDTTNRVADDPRAVRLGRALFFDPRLSRGGRVSCATCHDPARAFADGRALSQGLGRGTRNTPALWNLAHARWFFWDGRADSLWSQALKPFETPAEMGSTRAAVLGVVRADAELRGAYEQLFGPLDDPAGAAPAELARAFAHLGKAIAAFERTLVSARAPFDVFARGLRDGDAGKQAALSPAALRGARLFVGRGNCFLCHVGPLFSDGEFHDLGLPLGDDEESADPGRRAGLLALQGDEFGAAGVHSDDRGGERARALRHLRPPDEAGAEIKTPSLRNVALTAPYMHRGQFADLEAVLDFYSTHAGRRTPPVPKERLLVPLHLTPREIADLKAFLEALTDVSAAARE
jgi:cytochrome c peroxidase